MSNDKAWFERDPLPRAVIDKNDNVWVYNGGATSIAEEYVCLIGDIWHSAKDLEDDYGPCTPLIPENEQTKPLPSGALTIPTGELKRALELRMGEHAKRIIDNYHYHPEDAVKAGKMAQLALAVNPNTNTTWALAPVKRYATDEFPEN